jgi:Holliday junction resolvase RusA-like endonuclease
VKLILHGEPRSTNHIYKVARTGHVYMSKEGGKLKQDYHYEARSQWGRRAPLTGNVELWITLYFGTKRKADLDNYHELSLDALSGVVYEDDSQNHALHVKRAFDKNRPRIEIEIVPSSPFTVRKRRNSGSPAATARAAPDSLQ